ncbi:MAG: hypothetical protein KKF44_00200 [Nanoarchaeota archaeon]|nr:hypothetical protein [Nanoarchaeota archaeon]
MKKIQIKKNKKAEDGTSLLFKLIVVLIVLLLVFTLLMKYTPLGDLLLSFLEALGLYKLQAYTSPDAGNTQALNSIYGLMYAVNRISWYETNFGSKNWDWNEDIDIKEELKKDLGSDIGSFSDMIREYGDTGVYPTIIDSALYMYNSNDVDEVSVDIARKILQCWDMYNDLQKKNTRCFSLDFGTYSGEGIERLNIEEGLIYLRDTDKENECDKSCKEKSEEILGGFFQDWTIRDRTQWKFDIDGAITSENSLFGSKDKRLIQICAETGNSIFTLDRIYITDQIDVCKTPLDEFKFGFMVQDFKLPEDVATGLSAGGQTSFYKRFIGAYGDPKYMVYYEKFPEGEDDAWAGYPFDDLGTTTIGIVSGLLLRRLPFGSKIAEVIRKPQVTMAIANLVTRTIDIVRSSPDFFSASFLLIQEIEESITEIAEKVVQFFDPSSIEPEPTELKEYLAVKYVGMPLIGEILESKKSSAESIPDYNAVKKQLVSNYMDLVESNKESLSYDFVDESGKPTVRFMTLLKEGMFEEGLSEEQKISLSAVKEEILEEISILFIDYYQDYRFLTNIAYRVNTEI